jgi:5-amino-6-(5-phosphoribosylamino)uracil reductase
MSDLGQNPAAAVELATLGPVTGIDPHNDQAGLAELYAYPQDRQRTWVRANFITSLDGGATAEGRSAGLGGPGDRSLFLLLRALADVIVVGAGTVRIENYSGAHLSVTDRQHRQGRGQSEVPRLAIVTKSGDLSPQLPVFTQTEVAPLVLTCAVTAEALRPRLDGLAEVVDCSGPDRFRVDEATALAAVTSRGHRHVLTEGGPTLLGSLIDADLLDELCLTIAPYVVGGQARRVATGPGQVLTRMRPACLLTDDAGYLYTRYVKDA